MNTLYISDLDGTLLNKDALLSDETHTALTNLIESGVHFTCATARTAATVVPILSGIRLSAPAILMNGVAILDWNTHEYVKVEYLNQDFCTLMIGELTKRNLTCFPYSIQNHQLFAYYKELSNQAMSDFYLERVTRYQKPYTKVEDFHEIATDSMIYFLLLDRKETLAPMAAWLADIQNTYEIDFCFYPEIYLKDTWCLEVFSKKASKYNAVQFLRSRYGYDHIIGFGDNLNDLALFQACDEAYAVSNAKDAVKAAATAVIGSNVENSVAEYILKREHLK